MTDENAHPSVSPEKTSPEESPARKSNRQFFKGVGRAFAGAVIFSLPMMMTMEMWWLGFYIDPLRFALLILIMLPVLVGLSHYSGFEETFDWLDDAVDAFAACAVGFATALLILPLMGVIEAGMPIDEILGKVAIQAVPGSIGALLAESQLARSQKEEEEHEQKQHQAGYFGELFIMAVGALFLAFNVAPTEEMILISYQITPSIALALMLTTLLLMHGFIYAMQLRDDELPERHTPWWSAFARFTLVAYAIALLMSAYMLWTFGRTDDVALSQIVMMTLVLGFPAAIGAAAARLIL